MHTLTIAQPFHHAATGHTYRVRARFDNHSEESFHWTEAEALDARDEYFDRGAHAVHVAGLPCRVAVAGFPVSDCSLLIQE